MLRREKSVIVLIVWTGMLFTGGPLGLAPRSAWGQTSPSQAQTTQPRDLTIEQKLVRVRRIYVENFGDDPISRQTQAMVVDALVKSKRFIVTENKDRADAILKGSAVEKRSQEVHAFSEDGKVSSAAIAGQSSHSAHIDGDANRIHGSSSGSSTVAGAASSAAVNDSQVTTETIDDARIAVRLVDPDGDVLWSTTQESTGAKYKGASADAAERVAKQLLRDLMRIEKLLTPTNP